MKKETTEARNNIDYFDYVSDVLPELLRGKKVQHIETSRVEGTYHIKAVINGREVTAEAAGGYDAIVAIRDQYEKLTTKK